MYWLRVLLSRCVAYLGTKRLDEELDEELRVHIDLATDEKLQQGMSVEDARRAALLRFGGVPQTREVYRLQRGLPLLSRLFQDVRFAWRQVLRARGFALIAVLTLALGIGANTAVFTLTHALLLSTLPVRDPGELVRLSINMGSGGAGGDDSNAGLSLPMVTAIQKQTRTLHDVFGWCVYDFPFRDGIVNSGIHGAVVSGNAFAALGTHPIAGRLLLPEDDRPGGGPDGLAAVVSYRLWVSRYHADPAVVGKHVTVTDHEATIVGVAPPGFEGVIVAEHPDIYLPLEFQAVLYGQEAKQADGNLWLQTFARLNPGTSRQQAAAEMDGLFPRILDATLPPAFRRLPVVQQSRLEVDPARTGWSKLRAQYTQPLLVLQIMVSAVLLICCANLSGLFLARASARRQEFAIRRALGAGRLRLMQQLFVECLMLAFPGALLGVGLAWISGPWILHMLGNAEAEEAISMQPNPTVLCVTAACAVVCALLFGMAPAWTASRTRVEPALRTSHPRVAARGVGLRDLFVPLQVALSLTLVVAAALLGTTVTRLLHDDSGYQVDHVDFALTDFLRVPQKGQALVQLYRRMAARIQEMPGIEQTSFVAIFPLMGSRWSDDFTVGTAKNASTIETLINFTGAHYFSAMGIPLLAGRDFTNNDSDRYSCILSSAAARLYFPGGAALQKTLRNVNHHRRTGDADTYQDCRIVGIVQDAKYDTLREAAPPIVYRPVADGEGGMTNAGSNLYIVVRAQDMNAARSAYLAALRELAPTSPEIPPVAFSQILQDSVGRERLLSVLSGFFALLGLLLSSIGIYGLVAWNVTRRTTEIGLRMALGATRPRVFLLVIRQVLGLLAIGVLLGAVGALGAASAIRRFLFEVQPGNPWVYAFSAVVLLVVGLLAASLPARRALWIDPMQALKTE